MYIFSTAMKNHISRIGCISAKIGRAPLQLLETLTIPQESRRPEVGRLKKLLRLDELIYLATCNRVEFIFLLPEEKEIRDVRNGILDYYFRDDISKTEFEPDSFRIFTGRDAIKHIFRVASSLDSIVIGEAQILGQLKEAHKLALDIKAVGSVLDRVMAAAFRSAKTVRTETDLGKKPVSMASLVALRLQEILEKRPDSTIALVGAGVMTAKMAQTIRKKYNNRLIFVNRTIERIMSYALQFEGEAVRLSDFLEGKSKADIVISSTASDRPVFDISAIYKIRTSAEYFYAFDLAVPRDFSPNIPEDNTLDIWDIERLNRLSSRNRRQRFRVADRANNIVEQHVREFIKKEITHLISPLFHASMETTTALAEESLDKLFEDRLSHLSDADRRLLIYWSRKLLAKTSFIPAKNMAEQIVDSGLEDSLQLSLFPKKRTHESAA